MEDVKINVKIKLSALWVAAMFLYVYGDIVGFMKPGAIEHYIKGIGATGSPITQVTLLGIAIFMAIPSVMVFLSLTLKPKANRWANIIASAITIAFVWAGGSTYLHYIFFAAIETVCMLLIVWYAWKWPNPEA